MVDSFFFQYFDYITLVSSSWQGFCWEIWWVSLKSSLTYEDLLFFCCFKKTLWLGSLIIKCFRRGLFGLILVGIPSASWLCICFLLQIWKVFSHYYFKWALCTFFSSSATHIMHSEISRNIYIDLYPKFLTQFLKPLYIGMLGASFILIFGLLPQFLTQIS